MRRECPKAKLDKGGQTSAIRVRDLKALCPGDEWRNGDRESRGWRSESEPLVSVADTRMLPGVGLH